MHERAPLRFAPSGRPAALLAALAVLVTGLAGCGGSKTPTEVIIVPDTLLIASISPAQETKLAPGIDVTFTGTVTYRLNSADSAPIVRAIQDQSGHSLVNQQVSKTVTKGEGQVTLSDSITVPKTGVTQIQVIFDLSPTGKNAQDTASSVTYTVGV